MTGGDGVKRLGRTLEAQEAREGRRRQRSGKWVTIERADRLMVPGVCGACQRRSRYQQPLSPATNSARRHCQRRDTKQAGPGSEENDPDLVSHSSSPLNLRLMARLYHT